MQTEEPKGTTVPSCTAYYTISLALNVLLTCLITLRILSCRRKLLELLPEAHRQLLISLVGGDYHRVSSHSPCFCHHIRDIVRDGRSHQSGFRSLCFCCAGMFYMFALECTYAAYGNYALQQVATYLIIYRVADGKAWVKQTPRQTMTSVKFASRIASVAPRQHQRSSFSQERSAPLQRSRSDLDAIPRLTGRDS